jgi:hypothetical protein
VEDPSCGTGGFLSPAAFLPHRPSSSPQLHRPSLAALARLSHARADAKSVVEGANVAQEIAVATHGEASVNAVNVGDKASDSEHYLNSRAEAFWRLREWLRKGSDLVSDHGWDELLTIRYRAELNGKLKIMSKHDMRNMGFRSPNHADALMLTFVASDDSKDAPVPDTEELNEDIYDN